MEGEFGNMANWFLSYEAACSVAIEHPEWSDEYITALADAVYTIELREEKSNMGDACSRCNGTGKVNGKDVESVRGPGDERER